MELVYLVCGDVVRQFTHTDINKLFEKITQKRWTYRKYIASINSIVTLTKDLIQTSHSIDRLGSLASYCFIMQCS